MEEKELRSLELNVLGLLSSFPLSSLSLLLVFASPCPIPSYHRWPVPTQREEGCQTTPPQEDRLFPSRPHGRIPSIGFAWITCLSLGPISCCCQGGGHCHWPHTCPLLVVGWDPPPEEKRWEGSVDLPTLELHAREKAPRVKGYKMTPSGSKVFINLYKFPFLLI